MPSPLMPKQVYHHVPITILNSSLLLCGHYYCIYYRNCYHCYHQQINSLLSLIFISASVITASCHHCVCNVLYAESLKATFILQIKDAITDWRPVTCVSGHQWVKNPPQSVEEVADSNNTSRPSNCAPFHHAAALLVSVGLLETRDDTSRDENRRLIGYGGIVDFWSCQ